MPNQSDPNQPTNPATPGQNPAPMVADMDIPPMPPGDIQQPSAVPQASSDTGSAAPSDIPPVVSTPKKKFGGGRIIATILGVLLLVGGIASGVVLTRQQQLFQQKAKEVECEKSSDCGAGYECKNFKCVVKATPKPTEPGGGGGGGAGCPDSRYTCKQGACASGEITNGSCTTSHGAAGVCCRPVPPPCDTGQTCRQGGCSVGETATRSCETSHGETGVCCAAVSPCDFGQTCKQAGCAAGEVATRSCKTSHGETGVCCKPGGPTPSPTSSGNGCPAGWSCDKVYTEGTTCQETWAGSIQQKCKLTASDTKFSGTCCIPPGGGGGGPVPTPTGGGGGGITAQCLNIKAYNTGWVQLTAAQLSALKAGDKVRFTVAGSASSGTFDKARFIINGTTRPEVTGKRPGSQEFFDEYTIPTGVKSFTINAQVHHSTLGWF